jgi:hypothetical protein
MPWYKALSVILEIGSTSYKLLEGGLFVSLLGLLLVTQNVLYQVGTCPCPKHFHHHHHHDLKPWYNTFMIMILNLLDLNFHYDHDLKPWHNTFMIMILNLLDLKPCTTFS